MGKEAWIDGVGRRTCALNETVEVVMRDGACFGPSTADKVVWRDVQCWRIVAPALPPQPVPPSLSGAPDWIEWHGGDRPVDGAALVAVKLRDGTAPPPLIASSWRWGHTAALGATDIMAYRVLAAPPVTLESYRAEAVAEHDRLTGIIAAKEKINAGLIERNATLAAQVDAADTQLARVREQLVDAESQLNALCGSDRAALAAMTVERDALRRRCDEFRELARYGIDQTRALVALQSDVNAALLDGRIPMAWRDK